jgi:uncharacterized protein
MRQAARARASALGALLVVLVAGAVSASAAPAVSPAPTRWVTDGAGFLSPAVRDTHDKRLQQYQAQAGHQILVWIGRSTGSQPLEDFTVKAFAAWRVGRKGIDDGLVIFLFADDRKIRFEVGYGLEGQVPDAIASRIINDVMLPRLKGGDRDGAVVAGVDAVVAVIEGRPWTSVFREGAGAPAAGALSPEGAPVGQDQAQPATPRRHQASPLQKVMYTILGIIFLVILITHPSFALWLLFSLMSGGRGGGDFGGGGGGGFSGGGGRSGGGGASGSW